MLIQSVVAAVVLAPALWTVGKEFVGKDKAKFTDAVWIAVLGVIINAVIGFFLTGNFLVLFIRELIGFAVWIGLTTHFFDCGILKGIAISIIAGIILWIMLLIISAILVALGFSGFPSGSFY